jgi:flavodoxin
MPKKILLVYYSRTGNNKKIAKEIAGILKSDIDEIISEKSYGGIFGFLRGGHNSMKKKIINIKTIKNRSEYDLIIVGGPIWAGGSLCPPVRAYLVKNKISKKKIAFFSCCGSGKPQKSIEELQELNIKPIAMLFLSDAQVKEGKYHEPIFDFCNKIKKIK